MNFEFEGQVDHVAGLARLELDPAEKNRMAGQLRSILDTARRIQELDTDGVEPTSHVVSFPALLRDDEPRPSMEPAEVLRNAPRRQENYFRVPSINAAVQPEGSTG